MFDLEAFRKDVENFSGETNLEYYLNWSGQKDELELSSIYDKYARLSDRENVARIKELRGKQKKGGEEERRLRYLQSFAVERLLGHGVRELTDESETIQASQTIKVDDEEIPYRLAQVKLFNEDNRERRRRIFQARNNVMHEKLNPVLERRMEKLHTLAKDIGYTSYTELYQDTTEINFDELARSMTYFVQRTESIYTDKIGEAIKRVSGVQLLEAEKHDAAYLFRAKDFDRYFIKEKSVPVLERTLRGMGVDLVGKKNVMIDLEERPKKNPRAFTSTVRIPEDIRLVVMPGGGQDDYGAILHEAGHTVHYASVNPMLPVEYKWLGDAAVTETYAYLLEYLSLNRAWLNENIGIKDLNRYLHFAYLLKLYFLRRYAAKVKFEIALHSSRDIKHMGIAYKEELEAALKFRHPEVHYLTDLDDGFYSAEYLRAWIFEAQLRSRMIEKYGETWFRDPEAGKFLAELWSNGQKYNVTELARRIGFKGLDIKPLLAEIRGHLEQGD